MQLVLPTSWYPVWQEQEYDPILLWQLWLQDEDLCIHPRLYSMERRTDICDKHAWRYYIRITSIYGNHIKLSIVQENTGYMKPTTACSVVSIEAETMRAFTSEATRGVHTVMLTAVVTLALINICIIIILLCYNCTCTPLPWQRTVSVGVVTPMQGE